MSNTRTPAQLAAEDVLMDGVDGLMKAAAASAPPEEEFAMVDDGRFEARVDVPVEEEKEEEDETSHETTSAGTWLDRPTIKDQAFKLPDTVRMVAPTTTILNLNEKKDLERFNELQAEATKDAPKLAITEVERNFFEGNYSACVTYCKIEYQKL